MTAAFDEVLKVAVDNHGYLTSADALAAGIDPVQLRKLVASGRLERSSHGVYRVPVLASGPHAVYAEAVAWTRGRGAVSHESALDLLELCDVSPPRIHITVPSAYAPRRQGGELYRVWRRNLLDTDVTHVDGIATTRADRSIRDCIRLGTDPDQLERACRTAFREGYFDRDRFEALLARVQIDRRRAADRQQPR